jgi:cation diffusion facilitator CzcD-associated flavoprotein CzcO
MTTTTVEHVTTVIVGSGFAGICAAIKLQQSGRSDYAILERAGDVGGTWRDNSYPGCACDVPSYLYSFSFAPNPDWQHAFSRQPQILDYLRGVVRDYGLTPRLRLRTELLGADWDSATGTWQIETSAGPMTADHLLLAVGPLSEPSVPPLPGLDRFEGTTFHSAAWDHDHDLTGERVAIIGTGASAIQFVPHVQRRAGRLTLFQRTAPWVLPRRDRPYSSRERRLNRLLPGLQRAIRARMYAVREFWLVGFTKRPGMLALAEKLALKHLEGQVPDPGLRAKLTPHFRLGCKRVLLSNDYYPALVQPNAEVVSDRIVEVLRHAVVTETTSGGRVEHPADTIIFGTGFRVTDPPVAELVRGSDGRTLAEHWASAGMSALHGLTVAGFPNLFFMVGPNTGLGHTSIVLMIEAQLRYLLDLLDQVEAAGGGSFEPRREAQDRYNARVQAQLAGTVWNTGGCSSWYLDSHGRNTTLYPTFTFVFIRELRHARLEDYDVKPAVAPRERVPA